VGRGIALLFHDRGIRRGECSATRPGRTLLPGKTRYRLYRRLHFHSYYINGKYNTKPSISTATNCGHMFRPRLAIIVNSDISSYKYNQYKGFIHIFFPRGVSTRFGVMPPPPYRASRTHSDTPHSVGLPWTSDQPDAETSTWQHTTLSTDGHPCLRRDSNPQSQHNAFIYPPTFHIFQIQKYMWLTW